MTERRPIALAFALALAGAYVVVALQRPPQNPVRGHDGLTFEVCASVVVSLMIFYLAVFPAMERFRIGVP